jgi:hypothetical protein
MRRNAMKIDRKLLNGYPKVTVIESFDKRVKLLRQFNGKVSQTNFSNIEECRKYVENNRLEINVCHLHGDYRGPLKGDK